MIYFFLSVILFLANSINYYFKGLRVGHFISFFILCLFLGLRKDVGLDYKNYVSYYNQILFYTYLEPSFNLINLFVFNYLNDSLYVFLISGFLALFFIYLYFLQKIHFHNSVFLTLFQLILFLYLINGIRQSISVCIFVYSTIYLNKNKKIVFIFLILLASTFHYSAFLLLPIVFFIQISYSRSLYFTVYLASLISIGSFSLDSSFSIGLYNFSDYGESIISSSRLSIGNLSVIFINFIVLTSSLYHNIFKIDSLNFNLFFIYCVLFNLQMSISLINRFSFYFYFFDLFWIFTILNSYRTILSYSSFKIVICLFLLYFSINIFLNFTDIESYNLAF